MYVESQEFLPLIVVLVRFFALLPLKKKKSQPRYFVLTVYKSMLEMDTLYFKGCKYYHRKSLVIKITFS